MFLKVLNICRMLNKSRDRAKLCCIAREGLALDKRAVRCEMSVESHSLQNVSQTSV